MGCWRFGGEAGDFEMKVYWWSLLPKVEGGVLSVDGGSVGSCCVFAML